MGVQWYSVFDEVLQDQPIVRVSDAVRAYVRREPTRAELHAARRAANRYAERGFASVVHVPHRGVNVLLLVRDHVDVEHHKVAIEEAAAGRVIAAPTGRGPRSDRRALTTMTQHVISAGTAARTIDVGKIDPEYAMVVVHELDLALQDLNRLRDRLARRSTHGRLVIG